jgi:hypothetical protein
MNLRQALIATLLGSAAAGAFAQAAPAGAASTPGVDARQQRQEARIQQGAASGALTAREQHRLERQQKHIARTEARAKADGTVTPGERAHMHRQQDRAGRNIRHQKHDRQHQPAAAASAP